MKVMLALFATFNVETKSVERVVNFGCNRHHQDNMTCLGSGIHLKFTTKNWEAFFSHPNSYDFFRTQKPPCPLWKQRKQQVTSNLAPSAQAAATPDVDGRHPAQVEMENISFFIGFT